jgi:hypothetical protein
MSAVELSDSLSTHQPPVLRTAKWSPTLIIIAAGLIAFALKTYCAATTFGSCDVTIHAGFGQIIDAKGIDYMYRLDRHFNHPPVTGQLFALLYHFSAYLTPPAPHSVPRSFPFLIRLPSILADFFAVLVLLRIRARTGMPPLWELVLFALSPVAFMVSGFHGNVDPIMVCLLLIAAYFCVEEHAVLSAMFLAFACGIKIIPLFLTPVFFFFWAHRGRKAGVQFAATFAISCLAMWSTALVGSAYYFLKNVLGYNSYAGGWGITYWCVRLLDAFHFDVSPQSLNRLMPLLLILKIIVVLTVTALAWFRRNKSGTEFLGTIGLAWTCFAIFAPGFIPYYLVWMAPFVLLYSPTWYAVLTAASSIYLFAYYNMMSHGIMPWYASDPSVPPAWNNWGTIPWFVMVAIGVSAIIVRLRANRATWAIGRPAGEQVVLANSPEAIS